MLARRFHESFCHCRSRPLNACTSSHQRVVVGGRQPPIGLDGPDDSLGLCRRSASGVWRSRRIRGSCRTATARRASNLPTKSRPGGGCRRGLARSEAAETRRDASPSASRHGPPTPLPARRGRGGYRWADRFPPAPPAGRRTAPPPAASRRAPACRHRAPPSACAAVMAGATRHGCPGCGNAVGGHRASARLGAGRVFGQREAWLSSRQ